MGNDEQRLLRNLQHFTTRHTSHHTPLALVTSGGTAAPLEHNCVRFLDNFSTGTRGAHAVEEFCKRGYAVIHLKREGSISPFGRVLGTVLKCGRGGPDFYSLGLLFDCADDVSSGEGGSVGDDDFGLQDVDEEEKVGAPNGNKSIDPWLYSCSNQNQGHHHNTKSVSRSKNRGELSLNPRLVDSSLLQSTLRTYKHIKRQGMLLTIDFQTVDEYLHKLQLCCESINICGPLGLVYLAAAVSDFYIPNEKKVLHKIPSRDYGIKSLASAPVSPSSGEHAQAGNNTMKVQSDNTLTLTLFPVPKVIPSLREQWCPNAFVVCFKLETDASILVQKSVMAMGRNDVHLVIGNELATRYEKVFIISRINEGFVDSLEDDMTNALAGYQEDGSVGSTPDMPEGYKIAQVTAAHGLAMSSPSRSSNEDALEYATIEHVVRRHFYHISTNKRGGGDGSVTPNLASAAELTTRQVVHAASQNEKRMDDNYRQLQRERLKLRVTEIAWNVAGSAIGMAISYSIARMLQGRQHGTV